MSIRARSLVVAGVVASLALAGCGSRVDESPGASDTGANTANSNNTASDTGVTPTSIKIGSIAGLTSQLFGDTFAAPSYGAQAYFEQLNAAGGVNGRKVEFIPCDDEGVPDGNTECVRELVEDQEVFALTGGASFAYPGAQTVDSAGVPDVGGQPVTNAYDQYPHLYSIAGSIYPRTGDSPGYNGTLYAGTEQFRFFKERADARVAAVVYYNVPPSQRYANSLADGLRAEGYTVVPQEINLQLGNWEAAVLNMKNQGVQLVFDAMDAGGNTALCKAIETQRMPLLGKVTTSQGWTDKVREVYGDTPTCRNALYATGTTANYYDTDIKPVSEFIDAVDKFLPDDIAANKSMWMFEGYGAAKMLTAAMDSCGADLTRKCVEDWLANNSYDGDGMFIPRSFKPQPTPPTQARNCLNVARWQDSANSGKGGWETQVDDMTKNCFDVPMLGYAAG